ncbi:MAG: hypothetical protein J4O01_11295 [Chloroflexi bacterium]|nr:hypothetical protein [Chloroflexota bacterium]MCH8114555.1 hypothetical protein [Chloroflexota bacterium]MCH8910199.1 hypothetical protein [Chloroflexota bacterium]MCI0776024.1 hypothetical protein [Chloroflexota bacterium]MCI0808727.1 hypothetical protein [Chloroflexota bacterium]
MASPDTEATTEKDDEAKGGTDDIFDDIFAEEETEDSERLKAFADLEQLTMTEIAAETEAVLEELKIRQGG